MIYHNYIFFQCNPQLHDGDKKTLATYKKEFLKELEKPHGVITYAYVTLGLKANTTIMIWFQADSIDTIQDVLNKLLHTKLGNYLTITYTLFGMTRPTQYSPKSTGYMSTERKGRKYLIIYPFT